MYRVLWSSKSRASRVRALPSFVSCLTYHVWCNCWKYRCLPLVRRRLGPTLSVMQLSSGAALFCKRGAVRVYEHKSKSGDTLDLRTTYVSTVLVSSSVGQIRCALLLITLLHYTRSVQENACIFACIWWSCQLMVRKSHDGMSIDGENIVQLYEDQ